MKTINVITTITTEVDPEMLRNYYQFEEGTVIYDLSDNDLEALFLNIPVQDMLDNSTIYDYHTQVQKNY